jgi:CheY-like chemotaxis protein
MVGPQAADKGLNLHIEGPEDAVGLLLGDRLRLTQVLLNLVGNAVKFTHRGRVTLAVWIEDADADALRLTFSVTDTGIGIPAERRADLFEAFTQLDTSSTRVHGGSGLGLAISARLVALMGGHLDVESIEGKGSTFWFSLAFPRAVAAPLVEAPPAPVLKALRGLRVLVAEDDPVNQVLIGDLLGRRGVEVILAATGTEAVAAATEGGFDLVLMDIRMPEMDGLTACRHIRALPGGGPPIIALTANALAGERERCLAAGLDGYLTKPIEPETLYAGMGHWLRLPTVERAVPRPASVDTATPALPGFDTAKVQRWLDQAPDAWHAMVRVFLAEQPDAIAAIGAALDADDRAQAADRLHRLRGAAGALGAVDLATAAERLERALAHEAPVAVDVRARLFAAAESARAVLVELKIPADEQAVAGSDDSVFGELSRRVVELKALLEAGNTRALDHLPWLERWAGIQASAEARELPRQIEALDFPAALAILRGLDIMNTQPNTAKP